MYSELLIVEKIVLKLIRIREVVFQLNLLDSEVQIVGIFRQVVGLIK